MTRALGSKYRLGDVLGSGAMGEVYSGVDDEQHEFAFKLLRPALVGNQEIVARFLREHTILTGLRHPNLVPVHDLVAEGNTVAIVMALVRGGDLRALLAESGPLLPVEVARIGAAIARALAAVHAASIVHGDVKPENVLMDEAESPRTPRLTDFGLARLVGESGGATVACTPQYASPEVAEGAPPTAKSDLYSLGVMLYEMSCGVPPFVGDSPATVLKQHVERPPARPGGMPDPLWELTNWLLKKGPRARPQSAHRVAAMLEELATRLAGQPAAPRLTTPPVTDRAPANSTATTQLSLGRTTPRAPKASPGRVAARPAPPPPPLPVARRRKRRWPRRLVIVALLVGAAGAAVTISRPGEPTDGAASPASTTSEAAAASRTTASAPVATVMPDLVGKSLAAAQDILPADVELEIVESIQQDATAGSVIAQEPKAGDPLPAKAKVTVARDAVRLALVDLGPVNGGWYRTGVPVSIAGTAYAMGLSDDMYCDRSGVAEYNLTKGYRQLTATAGIDDSSASSDLKVQLGIFGDGRELARVLLEFGKPVPIDVDVSGVLRLKFEWQNMAPNRCSQGGDMVLGDPTLIGLPGEAPSVTSTG